MSKKVLQEKWGGLASDDDGIDESLLVSPMLCDYVSAGTTVSQRVLSRFGTTQEEGPGNNASPQVEKLDAQLQLDTSLCPSLGLGSEDGSVTDTPAENIKDLGTSFSNPANNDTRQSDAFTISATPQSNTRQREPQHFLELDESPISVTNDMAEDHIATSPVENDLSFLTNSECSDNDNVSLEHEENHIVQTDADGGKILDGSSRSDREQSGCVSPTLEMSNVFHHDSMVKQTSAPPARSAVVLSPTHSSTYDRNSNDETCEQKISAGDKLSEPGVLKDSIDNVDSDENQHSKGEIGRRYAEDSQTDDKLNERKQSVAASSEHMGTLDRAKMGSEGTVCVQASSQENDAVKDTQPFQLLQGIECVGNKVMFSKEAQRNGGSKTDKSTGATENIVLKDSELPGIQAAQPASLKANTESDVHEVLDESGIVSNVDGDCTGFADRAEEKSCSVNNAISQANGASATLPLSPDAATATPHFLPSKKMHHVLSADPAACFLSEKREKVKETRCDGAGEDSSQQSLSSDVPIKTTSDVFRGTGAKTLSDALCDVSRINELRSSSPSCASSRTSEANAGAHMLHDLSSAKKKLDARSTALVERLRGAAQQRKLLLARSRDSLAAKEEKIQLLSNAALIEETTPNATETQNISKMRSERASAMSSTNPSGRTRHNSFKPFRARPMPATMGELGKGGQHGVPKIEKRPVTTPFSPKLGPRRRPRPAITSGDTNSARGEGKKGSTINTRKRDDARDVPFKARPVPLSTSSKWHGGQVGVPKVKKRPVTTPMSPPLSYKRAEAGKKINTDRIDEEANRAPLGEKQKSRIDEKAGMISEGRSSGSSPLRGLALLTEKGTSQTLPVNEEENLKNRTINTPQIMQASTPKKTRHSSFGPELLRSTTRAKERAEFDYCSLQRAKIRQAEKNTRRQTIISEETQELKKVRDQL